MNTRNSRNLVRLICIILLMLGLGSAHASSLAVEPMLPGGNVTLPLEEYQRLLREAEQKLKPVPSSYTVGHSVLDVEFHEQDARFAATVVAEIEVETFADEWALVQLLQPGAALEEATLNGVAVQLVQRADGLFWLSERKQKATLVLSYHVDASFLDRSYVTSIPVPQAAATSFVITIPQSSIDLAVSPASNLEKTDEGDETLATGTLPGNPYMTVTWRVAQENHYVLNRGQYSGEIRGDAIAWTVNYDAEMLLDGDVSVPLISTATTLVDIQVDGEPATVFIEEGRFAVRLRGAGKHTITLSFLSAVDYPDGVPTTGFNTPDVPVSRFELNLPGEKLVQVNPVANVDITRADGMTRAVFHTRMSQYVGLNWMEAIPEDVEVETRANAGVFQAVHAAEGVLYGIAAIEYEITRGETNVLEFSIPHSAQVNRISSPTGAIADWIPESDEAGDADGQRIKVFLNRAIEGTFVLNIEYELLLDAGQNAEGIDVPLIRALETTRQKGMLALLSSSELALSPQASEDMVEVGENQLPAFFRNQIQQTVSHTYKFHADSAQLVVNTITPERKQGKFNAQIDTLISIGEVTLKGLVSIENDVKSGVLRDLMLSLPADVNILGVTGPSIRNHSIRPDGDMQNVHIEFTQEMDGQFRVELNFERIMLDGAPETSIPHIEVAEADVEHGRIAIEALSVLEVQPSLVEQLTSLEINELPKALILKTTNPILLAYKYVKTERPFSLSLRITRHEEIDVQVAAIDSAQYRTLFTKDGLSVNRATFSVRNSRRQFLRLSLPADSSIWSVFVNGQAQKPAYASNGSGDSSDILIKMINSATAFPVELVYATRTEPMATFGSIDAYLPRPDMIVTRSNWDVFVPADPTYSKPKTNMDIIAQQILSTAEDTARTMMGMASPGVISGEPLRIELPTQGILYQFSKLYANQSDDEAGFSLQYVNKGASFVGFWLSLLATVLLWAAIIVLGRRQDERSRYLAPALLVSGLGMAFVAFSTLGASITPASTLALAIGVAFVIHKLWQLYQARKGVG